MGPVELNEDLRSCSGGRTNGDLVVTIKRELDHQIPSWGQTNSCERQREAWRHQTFDWADWQRRIRPSTSHTHNMLNFESALFAESAAVGCKSVTDEWLWWWSRPNPNASATRLQPMAARLLATATVKSAWWP